MDKAIEEARGFFKDNDYLLNFYNDSIETYSKVKNHLTLHNFSCNIRELLREKLSLDAPDKEIIDCSWFSGNYNKEGKPTRRGRIRYYLLGGIGDEKLEELSVKDELDIIEDKYIEKLDKLSEYTHITEQKFYLSEEERNKQFCEILNMLIDVQKFIYDSKEKIYEKVESYLYKDIRSYFYNNMPDELDVLSTHTRVEDIFIEMHSMDIDNQCIYIHLYIGLNVNLQYGSDSDVLHGDGFVYNDNYNAPCNIKINVNDFKIEEYKHLPVNTDSFYREC